MDEQFLKNLENTRHNIATLRSQIVEEMTYACSQTLSRIGIAPLSTSKFEKLQDCMEELLT